MSKRLAFLAAGTGRARRIYVSDGLMSQVAPCCCLKFDRAV
jgi:hypothetical protein